jgi:hypothetical protein
VRIRGEKMDDEDLERYLVLSELVFVGSHAVHRSNGGRICACELGRPWWCLNLQCLSSLSCPSVYLHMVVEQCEVVS